MATDKWKQTNLDEQVNLLTGFPFKSAEYTEDANGIPLVRGDNVVQGTFRWDDVKRWSRDQIDGLSEYFLNTGDVVLAMDRPWIEAGLKYACVSEHDVPCLLVQRVSRLRAKDSLDQGFLRYVIGSPEFTNYVLGVQTGTAVPHISGSQIKQYQFLLPSLPEQRAIAGMLGALDDKIELNRRMNRTLESMARAVFRQWFVENEDVDNWDVMNIEQVAERVAMGPFGSSIKVETFVDEGIPIISGQHLRSFMLQDTVYNFISLEHAERLKNANVQRGDIIFTHAGNVGNLAFIPEDSDYERYVVSQRQFYMRCNLDFVTPTFITFYFQSPEGQHKLLANMSSVGVPSIAQPVSYLRSIELSIPPKPILDKFEMIVSPLLKKYRANEKESRTLASLRDSLLPKLMRGEVRVKS